ncbi:MAG: hypothetical protein HYV07_19825 [Deltaproteobacteria bacterium]|nr:hypothetical protein [Deltaproteobacteria bacterium]
MSLRRRLVILVTTLVGVLLLAVGLVLDRSLVAWELQALDRELEAFASNVEARAEVERSGDIELEDDDDFIETLPFAILDRNRRVLTSRRIERVGLSLASLPEGAASSLSEDLRTYRTLHRTVQLHHEQRLGPELRPLTVVVAAPLHRYSGLSRSFRVGLGLAVLVGTVLGAFGAIAVARVSTKPLERLTEEIATIDARALDRRVSARSLDPELTRLAEGVNGALDRIQAGFEREHAFVARASHALRTPIASILSVAEISARRDRPAEEHRAALVEITTLVKEASTLIDGLLALTRADASLDDLHRANVQLERVGAGLERRFAPRAGEAGLSLTVSVPSGATISGDEARISELLEVLLDNAIRYTPRGGSVGFLASGSGDELTLEVWDTGPGIADDEKAVVLERFARGRAAELTGQPGTGLGLAVAKSIAEAHGTSLELSDRPGRGLSVRVRLPRLRA